MGSFSLAFFAEAEGGGRLKKTMETPHSAVLRLLPEHKKKMKLNYSVCVCVSPFGFLRRSVIQSEREKRGDTRRVFMHALAAASNLEVQSMTCFCGFFAFFFTCAPRRICCAPSPYLCFVCLISFFFFCFTIVALSSRPHLFFLPFLLFSAGKIHRSVFSTFSFAFSGNQRTSGASRNHKRHPLLQLLRARFGLFLFLLFLNYIYIFFFFDMHPRCWS